MVRLRFETDLGTSLKAFNDLSKAVDRTKTGMTTAAAEAKKLEQAAARIVQQNLTPQEKYNVALDKMARAVKAGKLSMDEAALTAGRLRQKLDEATKSSAGVFGANALSNIKSYLTGVVSISGAIAVFRAEMEAIRAENEKIAQSQLTAAQARDTLKRNIPATFSRAQSQGIEARSERLAAELGLPQKVIDVALAESLGASEGNVELAFSRTRAAGMFLKTKPEGIPEFAGALGDVGKSTRDPDALRNLGFMLSVGAESRVTDDKKLAQNLPAALAGAASYGATAEQGGALFDALSKAAADPEGRQTKTGVINTASQLYDFFEEQVKTGKFKATAVDTFGERMQALRDSPKLARQFADKASFEARVKGPMREFLLDPNSPISKEYTRLLTSFGTPQEQIALAKDRIDYLNEGRIAQTAATERAIAARTDQFRLGQDADLTDASREEIMERTRQISGQWAWFNRRLTTLRTGFTMSPEEAVGELEGAMSRERRGRMPFTSGPDPELIENTRQMIEELRAIRDGRSLKPSKPSGRQEN